ncbi:hypothetical protein [Bernardetia sp.]|uniref:hypothetical protein n=1 Tax=Bernardetia sp. TaxID=1937974 RepID=UPI0025BDCB03|nr:hypothetical protein [Bernardetia sp.]
MKIKFVLFFLTLLLSIFSTKSSFSQNYSLTPKPDSALVRFSVFDAQNQPLQTYIFFYGKQTKKTFSLAGKSNENNQNEILLPNKDTYLVYSSISTIAYQVPITNQENQFYNLAFAFPTDKADQLQPTPEKALVRILPINHEKEPQKAKIILTSQKNGKVYHSSTDSTNSDGANIFLIPTGDSYSISINSTANYDKIVVEGGYFSKIDRYIQYEGMKIGKLQPSLDSAVFSLTYLDLGENPVLGEVFTVISAATGKEYTTPPTDESGKAQIKVPIGDTYSIGIKYYENFMQQKVEKEENLYVLPLEILYPSSAQIEENQKEIEEANRKREEEWKKLEEEMAALDKKNEELRQERIRKEIEAVEKANREYEIQVEKLRDSLELIHKREEMEEVLTSNKYVWGTDTVVNAVFNRNPEWKRKLIVLDVTGSMYPYIEQVKYWYSLNYTLDSEIEFVLFNDGNKTPDSNKKIGKTGGIYQCTSCKITELEKMLRRARIAGDGGDAPENDMEAVLYATKNAKGYYNELVLVADNLSNVRDIMFVYQLDVPVRIILCGTVFGFVNEEYLNIAYLTGGSIHTIEEDIVNLSSIAEGKVLTIGEKKYRFTKGRFFRMK